MCSSTLLQPEDSSLVGRVASPEDPALWFTIMEGILLKDRRIRKVENLLL